MSPCEKLVKDTIKAFSRPTFDVSKMLKVTLWMIEAYGLNFFSISNERMYENKLSFH